MDLYLIRHGIAAPRETWIGRRDADRPLIPKGVSRVECIARGLQSLGVRFDRIVTSPYVRARQTADILSDVQACGRPEVDESLAFGDCAALIESLGIDGERCVALVGHEPDLSDLISVLVTGEHGSRFRMKKGGVARLSIDGPRYGRCASLEWLMAPKAFLCFADASSDETLVEAAAGEQA